MALAADRDTPQLQGLPEPAEFSHPVKGGIKLYRGGLVLLDTATGFATNVSSSTTVATGRCKRTVDNTDGDDGDLTVEVERGVFRYTNSGASIAATDFWSVCYAVDDESVALTDGGGTRGIAGLVWQVDSDGVWVLVGPQADLSFTAVASDVADILASERTAQACVEIPLTAWRLAADGAAIPAFSDGVADGFSLVESEAFGLRINDDSTTSFATCVGLPNDMDDTAAVVIHVLASKVGATAGDLTKLTFGAFFQTVGATYIADADAGGDTDAMTNAATKTTQEITKSIASGDVPPAPCALTLTMVVKNGTLGTDDLVIHRTWLEYTKKLLAS